MHIADKDLEMYFYMTATPEERSEMREEQYCGSYDDLDYCEEDEYTYNNI